jgi:hypothetical protein
LFSIAFIVASVQFAFEQVAFADARSNNEASSAPVANSLPAKKANEFNVAKAGGIGIAQESDNNPRI